MDEKAKKPAVRRHVGRMPDAAEGWQIEPLCTDADGVVWMVCRQRQAHTDDWVTVKVVANGRANGRANYWLVRNSKNGKIGYSRDYAVLKTNNPMVRDQLDAWFLKGMQ